jgi:hypothetical protein
LSSKSGYSGSERTSSDTFTATAKPMSWFSPAGTVVTQDLLIVACPKCNAQFMFYRGNAPRFDACGFETYALEYMQCDLSLIGIVDPFDNKLMLSVAS